MFLLLAAVPAVARERGSDARPASIAVVLDDNYPPYIFRDENGQLRGILNDLWMLWSVRTGIAVDLQAVDWGIAQKRMDEGRADVIDTLFLTPKREETLAFSAPYATLDVAIFFHHDLSGISDAESLRGFTVGVKAGDACIGWLAERGITSIRAYPNYESIIDALAARETLVACIDVPLAQYLTYKKGDQTLIRHTPPLYTGQFHWAARKGDGAMMATVRDGFARISPQERRVIEKR